MYLETERLTVRPHTPADFEDYFGYIMDGELKRMLGFRYWGTGQFGDVELAISIKRNSGT